MAKNTSVNFKNGSINNGSINKVMSIIVMGVSGCGKSTIAKALASRLDLPFLEGDNFHPPANVKKMSNSIGLNDDDRWPWLDILGAALKTESEKEQKGVVVSCSSLKRSYRDRLLNASNQSILFVYLDGSRETLLSRMQSREDHFMPSSLLDSQLEALEVPNNDELAITISIENSIDDIVDEAISKIHSLT